MNLFGQVFLFFTWLTIRGLRSGITPMTPRVTYTSLLSRTSTRFYECSSSNISTSHHEGYLLANISICSLWTTFVTEYFHLKKLKLLHMQRVPFFQGRTNCRQKIGSCTIWFKYISKQNILFDRTMICYTVWSHRKSHVGDLVCGNVVGLHETDT